MKPQGVLEEEEGRGGRESVEESVSRWGDGGGERGGGGEAPRPAAGEGGEDGRPGGLYRTVAYLPPEGNERTDTRLRGTGRLAGGCGGRDLCEEPGVCVCAGGGGRAGVLRAGGARS